MMNNKRKNSFLVSWGLCITLILCGCLSQSFNEKKENDCSCNSILLPPDSVSIKEKVETVDLLIRQLALKKCSKKQIDSVLIGIDNMFADAGTIALQTPDSSFNNYLPSNMAYRLTLLPKDTLSLIYFNVVLYKNFRKSTDSVWLVERHIFKECTGFDSLGQPISDKTVVIEFPYNSVDTLKNDFSRIFSLSYSSN